MAAALPLSAGADHNTVQQLSIGPAGGNGALAAAWAGASEDGSRVFFETSERLVAADTDSRTDVYENAGGTTTLVSAGAIGGNGSFNAFFAGASSDGARVFFGSAEKLASGDTDTQTDIYERSGGTTTQVSTGSSGGNGSFPAFFDGASADGSRVFFHTAEKLDGRRRRLTVGHLRARRWRDDAHLGRRGRRQRSISRLLRRQLPRRAARLLRDAGVALARRHGRLHRRL